MTNIIPPNRIKEVDRAYWSPKERAEGVHQIIGEARAIHSKKYGADQTPSDWDLLCWAIEYIAMQSIVLEDEKLSVIAKTIARWLWSTHYTSAEEIYPAADKLAAKFDGRISGEKEEEDVNGADDQD